jgi:hypothetical protein
MISRVKVNKPSFNGRFMTLAPLPNKKRNTSTSQDKVVAESLQEQPAE